MLINHAWSLGFHVQHCLKWVCWPTTVILVFRRWDRRLRSSRSSSATGKLEASLDCVRPCLKPSYNPCVSLCVSRDWHHYTKLPIWIIPDPAETLLQHLSPKLRGFLDAGNSPRKVETLFNLKSYYRVCIWCNLYLNYKILLQVETWPIKGRCTLKQHSRKKSIGPFSYRSH